MPPLRDCVRGRAPVLFVGINPGLRSWQTGHHFAGYSNRFWRLLHESGLVSEPITFKEDRRLPEWGLALTNLIARPTPGIDTLRPAEYVAGVRTLRRKVRRWRVKLIVFVGVTLYRAVRGGPAPVALGRQPEMFEGAEVYVVPNPSGRNAHYSSAEMLEAFRTVAHAVRRLRVAGRRSGARRRGHRYVTRLPSV
jgi:TDG/mug DNA glycosylase family protein